MANSLTKEDVKLIVDSWEFFAGKELRLVLDFYGRLFRDIPYAQYYFPKDMNAMALKLGNMIDLLVTNLHRFDDLIPKLEELGRFHSKLGIPNEDYPHVVKAFLASMKIMMGEDYRDEIGEAWKLALIKASRVMMNAPIEKRTRLNIFKKSFWTT